MERTTGTNDAKPERWVVDRYEEEYGALLGALRAARPYATLAVGLTTPYITASVKYGDDMTVINVALGESQRAVSENVGADLIIDYRAAFGGDQPDTSYYFDGIHPNDASDAAPRWWFHFETSCARDRAWDAGDARVTYGVRRSRRETRLFSAFKKKIVSRSTDISGRT